MRVPYPCAFIHSLTPFLPSPRTCPRLTRLLQCLIGSLAASALLPIAGAAQTTAPRATPPIPAHSNLAADYGKLPLSFEANQGQTDAQVRFLSRGSGYSLFLTDSAAVLTLTKPDVSKHARTRGVSQRPAVQPAKIDVVRMELAGASRNMSVTGAEPLPGRANYFIGNDPVKWHANVPTYAKVRYQGVYPGVDLVYYGNQRHLEYDFVVAPGADPTQVRIHFAGTEKLKINSRGELQLIAKRGKMSFHRPAIYQVVGSQRRRIRGNFKLLTKRDISFALGEYDHSRELVIDPTLEYSTYLGVPTCETLNGCDQISAMAVDTSGDVYTTGSTGPGFPVTDKAFETTDNEQGGTAFVAKLNSSGSALIYATYLGGSGGASSSDGGNAIAVDTGGNVYVTGSTSATNFPVSANAFQKINNAPAGNPNAFVSKLDASGSLILYSTYLGGNYGESGNGIAVDLATNAYVTGLTESSNFPVTENAFQKTNNDGGGGASNVFVTKFNSDASVLLYSTYLGGSDGAFVGDSGTGIAVDGTGNAYVTGYTTDTNFPVTKNAFQKVNNAADNGLVNAFISKFDPSGSSLVYSTYLGGSGKGNDLSTGDAASAITIDSVGNAFVTGATTTSDFPVTSDAFQKTNKNAGGSAFVTKIDPTGSSLIYSTYLGGSSSITYSSDQANAIKVDSSGNAYITGSTDSLSFPVTTDAFQKSNNVDPSLGQTTAFLAQLDSTGSSLLYSTYFGGTAGAFAIYSDSGTSIGLDDYGNVYFAGTTGTAGFPTTSGAFETTGIGSFVAKFAGIAASSPAATTTMLSADVNPQKEGAKVTFTADVIPSVGSGTPTGGVTFSIDHGASTQVTLDGTGHASYSTSVLTVGSHTIAATYSGDASYSSSSATRTETIVADTTSITLTSAPATAAYGQALSVTASLSGSPAPTGSLSYTLDGGATRTSKLASGSATLNLGILPAGSHALTVSYPGDSTYGSASQSLSFTVAKALLTATAASFSRPYGTANPPLTYALTGFVNGDTSAVVSGLATLTTTATTSSPAGTYPITFAAEALTATNYTFTYLPGTLTVTGGGSSVCQTIDYSQGFTTAGLSLNGGATVTDKLLQLTDGGFYEARSAFYTTAVPITSFTTDFTFQLLYPLADGITFTIQSNNPQEVGQAGGGLGYAGIPNSIAVKADLFDNNGEGFDSTGAYLDGAYPSTPALNLFPAGIHLHSGHIFAVHISYANNVVACCLK